MKKFLLLPVLMALFLTNAGAQQTAAEITFTFTRQSGHATNQFAVWIEDARGQHIKTLYATRFTANGGWKRRPSSIPVWVKQSGLSNMSKAQVDAVSSATPRTGSLSYKWDGADSRGTQVPSGDYVVILEGTLRWENQVLCRAPIQLGRGSAAARVNVEYQGDSTAEHGMIGDVKVQVLK